MKLASRIAIASGVCCCISALAVGQDFASATWISFAERHRDALARMKGRGDSITLSDDERTLSLGKEGTKDFDYTLADGLGTWQEFTLSGNGDRVFALSSNGYITQLFLVDYTGETIKLKKLKPPEEFMHFDSVKVTRVHACNSDGAEVAVTLADYVKIWANACRRPCSRCV